MNPTCFLRTRALAVFALFLGGLLSVSAADRPNIIMLVADDQRWDTLGAMGNKIIQTPTLDRLATDGVMFRNAYVTTAICCISRASILTGQYAARHGILNFGAPLPPEALAKTYPLLLREAGYRTAFLGKYGVGGKGPLPKEHFDFWKAMAHQPRYENPQPDGSIKHYTEILTQDAWEFLETCNGEQPFCMSISYKAPHVQDGDPRQFIYNPKYKDLYSDVTIPSAKNGDDEFFNRLPASLATEDNEARVRWHLRFEEDKYQEMVKGYYRLNTGIDDSVASIRKDLVELGMSENTVIVFIGDHGFYLGEHGLAGKWYGHEESIRVPLLVFDPRQGLTKRKQIRDEIVLNIDVAPTLLGLAGVDVPDVMQGKSLMPILRGEYPKWRSSFFYEHKFEHARIPRSEGVVSSRWKYLRYIDTEPVQEELYNLRLDPDEVTNQVNDRRYAEQLSRLRIQCDAMSQAAM